MPVGLRPAGRRSVRAELGRTAYRNGYRTRTWDTRVGTIELHVLIQHLADRGDLALGDPVDPERLDQVVDLAGEHAL
jgi:hypothetical protein